MSSSRCCLPFCCVVTKIDQGKHYANASVQNSSSRLKSFERSRQTSETMVVSPGPPVCVGGIFLVSSRERRQNICSFLSWEPGNPCPRVTLSDNVALQSSGTLGVYMISMQGTQRKGAPEQHPNGLSCSSSMH